ncbi:MAG TPA: hypothetical protein VGF06_09245 [Terriglobales bacterium]|jgi:hypothetical protein
MSSISSNVKLALWAALAMVMTVVPARAQSLTVSLSSSAVSFPLTKGSASNPGNSSISATTTCNGCFFQQVNVYAYFNSAAAALTNAGNNIPSSAFQMSTNGGAYQALTNTVPFGGAGAGLEFESFFVFLGGFFGGNSRTDTLTFNIDLSSGALSNLPPGTYTGTLNIRAQAP